MQPFRVLVVGGLLVGALRILGAETTGVAAAVVFMLTFFVGAVTVGLLVAAALLEPPGYLTSRPHRGSRCSHCGRGLEPVCAVWICDRCDTGDHERQRWSRGHWPAGVGG